MRTEMKTPNSWSRFAAAGLALAVAPLFGCGGGGGGGGGSDAAASADAAPNGPDAGFNEAACPSSYGLSSVSSTFSVPASTVGFDLDGDDMVNNNVATSVVATLINSSLSSSINDGSLRTLTELRDFTALGTDDSSVNVVLYGGIDSDSPADTADDFAGDESYYFDRLWVAPADCAPVAEIPSTYTGGTVEGTADTAQLYISALGGFVDFQRVHLSATIEADTAGVKTVAGTPALFGGAIPICSLSKGPGTIGMSALEDIVRIGGVQPDIDLDGDGLETIQAQAGDGVVSCTDGDGTVIMGSDCACDPRIADGFSITFQIDLVGATVLGPAPQ